MCRARRDPASLLSPAPPPPRPPRAPRGGGAFLGGGRLLPAALGLLLLLAAAACGPDEPRAGWDDPFPRGVVLAGSPIVCAPSGQWTAAPEGWSFRGVAEVACAVLEAPAQGQSGLAFHFQPDGDTAGHAFEVEWDGRAVPPEWLHAAAAPAATPGGAPAGRPPAAAGDPGPERTGTGRLAPGAWRVVIPPQALAEGEHRLSLTRVLEPDDAHRPDNRFPAILLELPEAQGEEAGDPAPFVPAAADRYAYVADLLLTGVAGLGPQKAAGFLFAGEGRWEAALPAGRPHLELHLENVSSAPARFRVRALPAGPLLMEAEVPPGRIAPQSVVLPPRSERVAFEVDGEAAGVFLWGSPRLLPGAPGEAEVAPEPPPIVLVTVDTTRRDALGAYGGEAGITPNLDRLAAQATVYDRAASTTSWTLPAHASMFTGLFAGRHGAGVTDHRLAPELPTLAGELRRRGYQAVGFAGGGLVSHRFGVSRGFDLYRDPEGHETRGDRLTQYVVELLQQRRPGPLFLFVNYFDPHYAYRAPADYEARTGVPEARAALAAPGEPPAWSAIAAGDRAAWLRALEGEVPVTAAARRWLRAVYLAEVAFMDAQIGRLFETLRQVGIYDDAWIVVVADHGELLGEGGYLSHAYRLDPELVHVPLLVKAPGQEEGRRSDALTSVADLFPTLLAAGRGIGGSGGAAGREAGGEGGGDAGGDWARTAVDLATLDGRPLGEPGDRGRVFYEEHRSRVHVLPNDHLRIAEHVYGVESRPERRVVWDGGLECARWEGPAATGGWRSAPCGDADPGQVLEGVQVRLGQPDAEAAGAAAADQLSAEDRAALRALGYL